MKFDVSLYEQRGGRGYWYRIGKPCRSALRLAECMGCGEPCLHEKHSRPWCTRSCLHRHELLGHTFEPGAANPAWKGDDAGYFSLHKRVYTERGKADGCVFGCSDSDRYEWANLTGHHEDVNDYAAMCVRCHRRFDSAVRATEIIPEPEIELEAC